jgi:hypothetical protein
MNEEILNQLMNRMKPGEINIFHKTSTGEFIWTRPRNLEQFCLKTLEELKGQREFHEEQS